MAQPIWNTEAGSLGTFPSLFPAPTVQLSASPVSPATTITYTLISGTLPAGLLFSSTGAITGTPSLVTQITTNSFTVRATDNLSNIRDRTFSISVSGSAIPQFTTPTGSLISTPDSVWIDLPITYSNPDSSNPVLVELRDGILPPGLEIDTLGVIRGYAKPPTINVTLPLVITSASETTTVTNLITCLSTNNFTIGRPVVFSGSVFGDLVAGTTYYIKSIPSNKTFTVSATQNGSVFPLVNGTGSMSISLPSISVGESTVRTYTFTLGLTSPLGGDQETYSITVINQDPAGSTTSNNTRVPTILNTRPLTYNITSSNPYYGYYVLPPVAPTTPAFIGTVQSGDIFAFKVIGYDFDGNTLTYDFSSPLPSGLTGDPITGWITGTPTLNSEGINQYQFSVRVKKQTNDIATPYFNFSFNVSNEITGDITWVTPSDLGTILNGSLSTLNVFAESDVTLSYRLISGSLPPELTLSENGEITGYVADQPSDQLLQVGDTTDFTFTIEAYSKDFAIVNSSKTFTVTVLQEFENPTDTLYIKATPSIADRLIIDSLLTDTTLIPDEFLYRPNDQYFGKASSVIYEHAYGIYASDIEEYIAAVTRNHYWRNITLGEIKTAVAKNAAGEIIYEVVYSSVIDNLVNPQGVSVSKNIYWPTPIDLQLGPWYTSSTDIFTSYEKDPPIWGQEYYTSLTPGYARNLYPNSLFNMRTQVADVLDQEKDSRLLPLWMTSQQPNGSTLGYTQAWVICYTEPRIIVSGQPLTYAEFEATGLNRADYSSYAETIQSRINTRWDYKLNQINFQIDRFSVDKTQTYNYDNNVVPPAWVGLPSASPVPNPIDSKDFYVLFPRQTILPRESEY
jgi:hypothetical protein